MSNDEKTVEIRLSTYRNLTGLVKKHESQLNPARGASRVRLRKKAPALAIFLIKITASTDANTYTGTIIDNKTDQTTITTGVTVKFLDHDAGTIPTGESFYCVYDSTNSVYYPLNYGYWF